MYRSRRYFLSFPISLKQNEEVSTINFSLKGIFCSIFAISKPTLQTNTHNFFPYLLFFIVIHLIYHIIHPPYFMFFFYFIWHLNLIFFILFYSFILYISTCNNLHASSIFFLLLILYYSFYFVSIHFVTEIQINSFPFLLPKLISILTHS